MYKTGADHHNWKGDQATYLGRHYRVYRKRGKASEYPCADCGDPARDWAQIHGTDGTDPEHYQPLCRKCHYWKYDRESYVNRSTENLQRGESHHEAKLTDEKVRKIRRLRADGWLQRDIAAQFGVTRTTVGDVLQGKIWRHVT